MASSPHKAHALKSTAAKLGGSRKVASAAFMMMPLVGAKKNRVVFRKRRERWSEYRDQAGAMCVARQLLLQHRPPSLYAGIC